MPLSLAVVRLQATGPVPAPDATWAVVPAEPALAAPAAAPVPNRSAVYVNTRFLQKKLNLPTLDFAKVLQEGLSVTGHPCIFVRIFKPGQAHAWFGSIEAVNAVVAAFADGSVVEGPLAGMRLTVERKREKNPFATADPVTAANPVAAAANLVAAADTLVAADPTAAVVAPPHPAVADQ